MPDGIRFYLQRPDSWKTRVNNSVQHNPKILSEYFHNYTSVSSITTIIVVPPGAPGGNTLKTALDTVTAPLSDTVTAPMSMSMSMSSIPHVFWDFPSEMPHHFVVSLIMNVRWLWVLLASAGVYKLICLVGGIMISIESRWQKLDNLKQILGNIDLL